MRKLGRGVDDLTDACVRHALTATSTLRPSAAFLLNMIVGLRQFYPMSPNRGSAAFSRVGANFTTERRGIARLPGTHGSD